MRRRSQKNKVFCIGLNKTGTTSWTQAMSDLGYLVGNERACEIYFDEWTKGNYAGILRLCSAGEAFQDVPFCLPGFYKLLHQKYPHAKFVLTVRDSAEQWYSSITRFHSKMWASDNHCPPTPDDIRNAFYIYRGWPAEFCRQVFQTPENDPYNRELLMTFYTNYNKDVAEYFFRYANSFLQINVAHPGALKKMCDFLGVEYSEGEFPWRNKT